MANEIGRCTGHFGRFSALSRDRLVPSVGSNTAPHPMFGRVLIFQQQSSSIHRFVRSTGESQTPTLFETITHTSFHTTKACACGLNSNVTLFWCLIFPKCTQRMTTLPRSVTH